MEKKYTFVNQDLIKEHPNQYDVNFTVTVVTQPYDEYHEWPAWVYLEIHECGSNRDVTLTLGLFEDKETADAARQFKFSQLATDGFPKYGDK